MMKPKTNDVSGLTQFPERKTSVRRSGKNWKIAPEGIVFEKKRFHLGKKAKILAVLFGLALAGCVGFGLYLAGVFNDAPKLPDAVEGEADFTTENGGRERYDVKIDFTEKILQFNLMQFTSSKHNRKRRDVGGNHHDLELSKIVIQDFQHMKRYLVIPGKNSTTKCIRTDMKGDMIPQDLLKRAKSEKISDEMKEKIIQRLRFGDNSEADVLVTGKNQTQNIIYRGHGWNMTMHSKNRKELNMTDIRNLDCFDYVEDTNSVDEKFYETNQSKYIIENLTELQPKELKNLSSFINNTSDLQQNENRVRHRRGILDKLAKWSHGKWCGAYTGGYENHCKVHCKAPYDRIHDACKKCNPTVDPLDAECMEHDRCLRHAGPGPKACLPQGNRCICDFNLVLGAMKSGTKCLQQGNSACVASAKTIAFVFSNLLSCWFPSKVCFPSVKVVCGCSSCSCPSLQTFPTCVYNLKLCVPFGSGKVSW